MACCLGLAVPHHLTGQAPRLRGYYLNVGIGAAAGPFSSSAVSDVQRLRLISAPAWGPLAFDIAYEHALSYTSAATVDGVAGGLGRLPESVDWLPLQGPLEESDHVRWTHRLDRLAVNIRFAEAWEVTVGRQSISWATTLVLTPTDPFSPFDPAEPFREYRVGIDAIRVRAFPGPFTEFDFVLRPADLDAGTTMTVLGRGRTVLGGWELAAWGGTIHDQAAAGLAATKTLAGAALRAEGVVRRSDAATVLRFAVGADRRFPFLGRDLYVIAEFQHDGFGATSPEGIVAVASSDAFARGELQTLSRAVGSVQASWQVSPLVSAAGLALWSVSDGSLLLAPSATVSLGDELTARAGVFVGWGDDRSGVLPSSEFGPVPVTVYLSLATFF